MLAAAKASKCFSYWITIC